MMLMGNPCPLAELVKVAKDPCRSTLRWCVPAADPSTVRYTDRDTSTTYNLNATGGTETLFDIYDIDFYAEICGTEYSKRLTVSDCGGRGSEYTYTTQDIVVPEPAWGAFCGGTASNGKYIGSESKVWESVLGPDDTYAITDLFDEACIQTLPVVDIDLGTWTWTKNTRIRWTNSDGHADMPTDQSIFELDCVSVFDARLVRNSLGTWLLVLDETSLTETTNNNWPNQSATALGLLTACWGANQPTCVSVEPSSDADPAYPGSYGANNWRVEWQGSSAILPCDELIDPNDGPGGE